MLHREIPFLRIGLPLCAGIICGYYIHPGRIFFIISAALTITGFMVSLAFNRRLVNHLYGLIFIPVMFLCGLFMFTREKDSLSILDSGESLFSGYLSDFPEEKEKTWKITLRLESGISDGDPAPLNGTLLIYHKKEAEIPVWLPGDKLIIRCSPSRIRNRANPYEFDYRFYLENRGIRYYAFTDSSDILFHSAAGHRKMTHRALIIRQRIIDMFKERGLRDDRLALVAAITLGQKNMLDPEQKQYFIKAGIMHIMAVSGLHAMILSIFVLKMLFFLRGRLRILKVLITLMVLWTFAFVTGLTPSVFRATLMFSFIQAGNLMKRPVNPVNSILASAFVLIMTRPSVIFDSSFLLSYSAVTFIIMFYSDLYRKIRFRYRIPDLIWQSAAVSLIAQTGTLSLSVMLFNRFPTWFILSNIVIVPISSLVIITGCLLPLTYPLPFISCPLAKFLGFVTGLTELLTARAASLPLSTINNIGMIRAECILMTITIFFFMRYILNRRAVRIAVPLSALLLLVLAGTIKDITTRRSSELLVYNSEQSPVGIRNGKRLDLWTDKDLVSPEVSRHCSALGLKAECHPAGNFPVIFTAGGHRILMTSAVSTALLQKTSPDILIIRGLYPSVEKPLLPAAGIKKIIVTSGTSLSYRISELVMSLHPDTLHLTERDGAFRLKL